MRERQAAHTPPDHASPAHPQAVPVVDQGGALWARQLLANQQLSHSTVVGISVGGQRRQVRAKLGAQQGQGVGAVEQALNGGAHRGVHP